MNYFKERFGCALRDIPTGTKKPATGSSRPGTIHPLRDLRPDCEMEYLKERICQLIDAVAFTMQNKE